MLILGLNAFHGDASAAVLRDGQLISALEEERLNRIKHWAGYRSWPHEHALMRRPPASPITSPSPATPRPTWRISCFAPSLRPHRWARLASRAGNSIRIAQVSRFLALRSEGICAKDPGNFHFVEHHRAHLASAFFASPFEDAAVVSIDGFGDFSSVMWGVGQGNRIQVKGSVLFPHSLGIFYTRVYAIPWLPQVRRRVQNDGPCRLWRAALRGSSAAGGSNRAGPVPAQPRLLHASHPRRRDDLGRR